MSDVTLFSYVILLTLAVCGVQGFPTGAPVSTCDDMIPQHGTAAQPITPNVPYTVTPSQNTYYGGEAITVTIMGGNSQFKGLLLQARDSNGQRVGTFSLSPNDPNIKLLACDNVAGSAVTHTNRNMKDSITVTWTAPMMDTGAVTFRATVVQQFNTFYVGLQSQSVSYMARAQPPLMNDTNTMPTMAPVPANNNGNNNNNNNGMNDMSVNYGGNNSAVSLAGGLLALVVSAGLILFRV